MRWLVGADPCGLPLDRCADGSLGRSAGAVTAADLTDDHGARCTCPERARSPVGRIRRTLRTCRVSRRLSLLLLRLDGLDALRQPWSQEFGLIRQQGPGPRLSLLPELIRQLVFGRDPVRLRPAVLPRPPLLL